MRIPVRAVGRSIGSRLDSQEILIEISLMCQIQALLAHIEHFILGAVNSSQIELDRYSLLLNKTQRALHLIHLANGSDSNGYKHFLSSVSFPPAVKIVLYSEKIEHPAHQHIHQIIQAPGPGVEGRAGWQDNRSRLGSSDHVA